MTPVSRAPSFSVECLRNGIRENIVNSGLVNLGIYVLLISVILNDLD